MNFTYRKVIVSLTVVFAFANLVLAFAHPGLLHKQEDLDRMAAKVAANAQPWKAGWDVLVANSHSSSSYSLQGPLPYVYRGDDGVHSENYQKLYNDIAAAYQNALRWHISGNTAHAEKAIYIMDAWSYWLQGIGGNSDKYLAAGIYGYEFANAAELMRNYSGWDPENFERFQNMMLNIFYPMNHDFLVNHNGACISHYWANWDECNMASILAIGVLCDRQDIYDEAIEYFKKGAGNGAIENAFWYEHPGDLVQCQESGRDQGHCTLNVSLMGAFCEMAWNQGLDLYGYLDNRFGRGCEYIAKYNLGNSVPFETYTNCDPVTHTVISSDGRGAERPTWEMIYNHYVNRMGWTSQYSQEWAEDLRPEGGGGDYGPNSGGYDQLGFGTLTCTRETPAVGAPTDLDAIPGNGQVFLNWTAPTGATSYNIKRSTTSACGYTVIDTNVPTNSYTDTTAINGIKYYYVVSAVNAGGESVNSAQAHATPLSTTPNAPTGLAATVETGQIVLDWNESAGAANYNVKRDTTSGGPYTTIDSPNDTTYTDTTISAETTYYYVVSAENINGQGPNSIQIIAGGIPSPWAHQDIGSVGLAGSASFFNDAFTVKGAGSDISSTSDKFHYAYKTMSGNGTIIARLASETIGGANDDKVGIMMRESVGTNSRSVFALLDRNLSMSRLAVRFSTSGTTTWYNGPSGTSLPRWYKLTRSGNTFTGYVSDNGTSWTTISSASVTMNTSILVGFAVCSRNTDALNTSVFDNITAPDWTDIIPAEPNGLTGTALDLTTVSLDWDDNSETDLDGYNIYRSVISGSEYTKLNTSLLSTSDYNDTTDHGETYYYAVTAVDDNSHESYYSDEFSITMPPYGDADSNGVINGIDLKELLDLWLVDNCSSGYDLNGNCRVDFHEYAELAKNWLE